MNVIVLAAGKGSRMKSDTPKVLHPVAGTPMLGHVLRTAAKAGATRLILVVGHGAAQVQDFARSFCAQHGLPSPDFALQDPPQGTGHAVAQAMPMVDPAMPSLVLYGDVPLIKEVSLKALRAKLTGQVALAVLTARLANPFGYGRILRSPQGNHMIGCCEEKDASTEIRAIDEVNSGILVADTPRLKDWVGRLQNNNTQAEYYLTDTFAFAHADGVGIDTYECQEGIEILGVNSQSQRAEIERQFQQREAQALMDSGVHLADPLRIDVRGELTCEADVQIDVNCIFSGAVWLGKGVSIGPNCVLDTVSVGEGCRIEAYSHLSHCKVGPQAVVGPYARIRPGSELGEGSHVGNFTEVKNTRLGRFSKANHLSYLGDAVIGERVNVGAGTITCNYDGAEKHLTIIEDDVFIGSDTQLVAPVTVHKGATLGAGTTLTSDAPEDALTLSRTRQTTLTRWKRPRKKAH
ncbi:MAG: bifunctional UDP-N-acetylglucosamine diphosphorylase/glucosamine-1-phosphate N-acetyltransferase GlmU [Burkholderiaceae bacterium]|nr:bifunctional UDP-N-acetylglucosamine diphosphorylase/glucosamine-1-phosphate N-acetyltransferase GlmU [Burkholderiaceae bacterium]